MISGEDWSKNWDTPYKMYRKMRDDIAEGGEWLSKFSRGAFYKLCNTISRLSPPRPAFVLLPISFKNKWYVRKLLMSLPSLPLVALRNLWKPPEYLMDFHGFQHFVKVLILAEVIMKQDSNLIPLSNPIWTLPPLGCYIKILFTGKLNPICMDLFIDFLIPFTRFFLSIFSFFLFIFDSSFSHFFFGFCRQLTQLQLCLSQHRAHFYGLANSHFCDLEEWKWKIYYLFREIRFRCRKEFYFLFHLSLVMLQVVFLNIFGEIVCWGRLIYLE